MNIMDLLSGELVKRREAPQQESLGSLMGFLSQGSQSAQLPSMSHQGSGLGSALLKQWVGDKIAANSPEGQAKQAAMDEAAAAPKFAQSYAANAPSTYTDPNTGETTPLSKQDIARYWQASPDKGQRSMGNDVLQSQMMPQQPHTIAVGVNGQPELQQQMQYNPDTQVFDIPIGSPIGAKLNPYADQANQRAQQTADIQQQRLDLSKAQEQRAAEAFNNPNRGLQATPAAAVNAYMANNKTIADIDNAIAAVEVNKDAFGLKNYLPGAVTQRSDPKGEPARNAVGKISSVVRHDLSGSAVTPSEEEKLNFIPRTTDDPNIVKGKLESYKQELLREQSQFKGAYTADSGYRSSAINPPASAQTQPTQSFNGRPLPAGWTVGPDGKPRKQ